MSYLNYNSLIEYEKLINGVRDWPDTLDAFDMNKYLDARSKNRRRSDKRNLNTYTFKYISREPILYKKKKKLTFLGFHIERIFISPSSETYNVHLYWFNKKIFTFKKTKRWKT